MAGKKQPEKQGSDAADADRSAGPNASDPATAPLGDAPDEPGSRSGQPTVDAGDPAPDDDPQLGDGSAAAFAAAVEAVTTGGDAAPADPAVSDKKKKKKKKKKDKVQPDLPEEPPKLGSTKAVDTLFRNSIRAELDIINLAAMKANIMISLNGLIISALMISGAFIFASSPAFLLPAAVFMFTASASIIFALLAASPERADLARGFVGWLRAVIRRQAGWRDIKAYLRPDQPDPDGDLNMLIYEHRVRLTPEAYWDRMQTMLRDRDAVYFRMSEQLYWLGQMAERKFRLLHYSYSAFRWGLLASVMVFLGVKGVFGLFPSLSGQPSMRLTNLGISTFTDIYEPSAVQQLLDGRVLVVEDESNRAISIMTLGEDGSLVEDPAADQRYMRQFGRKLNDLEGLTGDEKGNIYAVTSHSLTNKGARDGDREWLLRFKVAAGRIGEISEYVSLRDTLIASKPLKDAIRAVDGEAPDMEKLNIEGLAYHDGRLLLGLRDPRVAGKSVIIPIENPDQLFAGAEPDLGAPVMMDLQNGGIRALSYDPVLATFLIVNEIETHDGARISQLWSWSGQENAQPEPMALPDIINLNNVESIDSIEVHGQPRLLIMSDEGNADKNEPAKYMMLDYEQLGN